MMKTMPYKLIAHGLSGEEDIKRQYDQERVLIGRDEMSDLLLRDAKHLVSRKHVEIRVKEGVYSLVDLGSKNGTRLNKKRLVPEKEYSLQKGDQIKVGGFSIDFIPVVTSPVDLPSENLKRTPDLLETDGQKDSEVDQLVDSINRTYCDHLTESPEHRMHHLREVLKRHVIGRNPAETTKLLSKVESCFQAPSVSEQIKEPDSIKATSPPEQTVSNALMSMAEAYHVDHDCLKTVEGMNDFVARIDQIMTTMLDALANALKGRRRFEQEFDVNATRLLSWKLNPIKEFETGKEIGEYLLNSKKGERQAGGEDQAIDNLKEGYHDLALHHLGLIAGFKACLRGLLDQLSPDLFEIEGEAAGGVFSMEPMRSRAAWNRYREKYNMLVEEEVKTFETILAPYIEKGYLSVQKKKQVS